MHTSAFYCTCIIASYEAKFLFPSSQSCFVSEKKPTSQEPCHDSTERRRKRKAIKTLRQKRNKTRLGGGGRAGRGSSSLQLLTNPRQWQSPLRYACVHNKRCWNGMEWTGTQTEREKCQKAPKVSVIFKSVWMGTFFSVTHSERACKPTDPLGSPMRVKNSQLYVLCT